MVGKDSSHGPFVEIVMKRWTSSGKHWYYRS